MDPVQKMWMFESWIKDQEEQIDLAKNQAYLIGSFIDPTAVQKILGDDKYESNEEEVEESLKYIRNFKKENEKQQNDQLNNRRRRRKII